MIIGNFLEGLLAKYGKKMIVWALGQLLTLIIGFINHKWNLGLSIAEILAPSASSSVYVAAQGYADGKSGGATSSVANAFKMKPGQANP